jgi:hypothetical protein
MVSSDGLIWIRKAGAETRDNKAFLDGLMVPRSEAHGQRVFYRCTGSVSWRK